MLEHPNFRIIGYKNDFFYIKKNNYLQKNLNFKILLFTLTEKLKPNFLIINSHN